MPAGLCPCFVDEEIQAPEVQSSRRWNTQQWVCLATDFCIHCPFAVCSPGCFLFLGQVTVQKILPQREGPGPPGPPGPPRQPGPVYQIILLCFRPHQYMMSPYSFMALSPLAGIKPPSRQGPRLVHCSARSIWTAHHVQWGFDKHSQPDRLFLQLPGDVFLFRPSFVSPGL